MHGASTKDTYGTFYRIPDIWLHGFIAMNQLFDIALLFQGSGSYAFYGIPVLADNTNQVGERFLIYTNRIDKVDTAVDDSDLIAGCNIQSTHLLYNSVAL